MGKGLKIRRFSHWLDGRREHVAEPLAAFGEEPRQVSPSPPSTASVNHEASTAHDPFAEIFVDRRAALIDAFNPSHPVQRRGELCGRNTELIALFDALLNQRKHAIVHGARGSGKTSLVRVFGDYADQRGAIVIYMACEAQTSFGELMRHYLRFVPTSSIATDAVKAFEAGVAALDGDSRPRAFVELLAHVFNCQIVFILDEFDRVTDPYVQGEVATFMKLLSDADIPVHLLIVGIARSIDDVLSCHPSLRRHVSAVPIGRISAFDIGVLIDQGAARSGIRFSQAARELIIEVACGSPYHARVFCHAAGLEALKRGLDDIDRSVAEQGLARAVEEWGKLNEQDAHFFRRLATAESTVREQMIELAKVAALTEGYTQDHDPAHDGEHGAHGAHAVPSAEDVSRAQLRDISRQIFRDSSAPQFFLATVALVRSSAGQTCEQMIRHEAAEGVPQSVQNTRAHNETQRTQRSLLEGYGQPSERRVSSVERDADGLRMTGARATWPNGGKGSVWSVSADWSRPRL